MVDSDSLSIAINVHQHHSDTITSTIVGRVRMLPQSGCSSNIYIAMQQSSAQACAQKCCGHASFSHATQCIHALYSICCKDIIARMCGAQSADSCCILNTPVRIHLIPVAKSCNQICFRCNEGQTAHAEIVVQGTQENLNRLHRYQHINKKNNKEKQQHKRSIRKPAGLEDAGHCCVLVRCQH